MLGDDRASHRRRSERWKKIKKSRGRFDKSSPTPKRAGTLFRVFLKNLQNRPRDFGEVLDRNFPSEKVSRTFGAPKTGKSGFHVRNRESMKNSVSSFNSIPVTHLARAECRKKIRIFASRSKPRKTGRSAELWLFYAKKWISAETTNFQLKVVFFSWTEVHFQLKVRDTFFLTDFFRFFHFFLHFFLTAFYRFFSLFFCFFLNLFFLKNFGFGKPKTKIFKKKSFYDFQKKSFASQNFFFENHKNVKKWFFDRWRVFCHLSKNKKLKPIFDKRIAQKIELIFKK